MAIRNRGRLLNTVTALVMTGAGAFVEVQGTAEQTPFSKASLDELLALAGDGIARLVGLQRRALAARDDKQFGL